MLMDVRVVAAKGQLVEEGVQKPVGLLGRRVDAILVWRDQAVRVLVHPLPKNSRGLGQGLQLGHVPTRCPCWMFEKEVSAGCELLAHKLNTETHVRFRLLELDRKLVMPLGAIDRLLKIMMITEFRTKGRIRPDKAPATVQVLVLVAVLLGR